MTGSVEAWEPIQRGKPEVEGCDSDYPGLLRIRIPLDKTPPIEWAHFFENPTGIGISLSMHPPSLSGTSILIHPPDGEEERYVRHVDERITNANQKFEREVLPRLQARIRAQAEARESEKKRLESAQSRLDNL